MTEKWEPKRGDKVDYHSMIDGRVISKGHIIEALGTFSNGHEVAWISGVYGCISLKYLTLSKD
jgi:hypothetical protein